MMIFSIFVPTFKTIFCFKTQAFDAAQTNPLGVFYRTLSSFCGSGKIPAILTNSNLLGSCISLYSIVLKVMLDKKIYYRRSGCSTNHTQGIEISIKIVIYVIYLIEFCDNIMKKLAFNFAFLTLFEKLDL